MATAQEVADKYQITVDQVRQLRQAMNVTWGVIAYDVFDCFEGGEDECWEAYANDEGEMVAENTIDADRITTFCPDQDLKWVYRLPDGSIRLNCIELGKEAYLSR